MTPEFTKNSCGFCERECVDCLRLPLPVGLVPLPNPPFFPEFPSKWLCKECMKRIFHIYLEMTVPEVNAAMYQAAYLKAVLWELYEYVANPYFTDWRIKEKIQNTVEKTSWMKKEDNRT